MNYKKIITISFLITLMIPISIGRDWFGGEVSDFDPTVDEWDDVGADEIEWCQKWGGSAAAGINHGASSKTPIPLSQLTISLQGQRTKYNMANQSDLYEASWYIEPTEGTLEFKVFFIGDGSLEIKRGTATNTKAAFDYYTKYINKSYTHVKIEYPGNYLKVPIVS